MSLRRVNLLCLNQFFYFLLFLAQGAKDIRMKLCKVYHILLLLLLLSLVEN